MNSIENTECPICLEDIDLESGDFIELDCCKNKGHITCLENWIKVNKSNGKSYYCQQDNDYFKIKKNKSINNNIDNNIYNNTLIITRIESNNNLKKCFTIFFCFCIITLSFIIIFAII